MTQQGSADHQGNSEKHADVLTAEAYGDASPIDPLNPRHQIEMTVSAYDG